MSREGDGVIDPRLRAVMEQSRRVGFLGPGAIEAQVEHALGYLPMLEAATMTRTRPGLVADLGAGGGLPSLPLVMALPDVRFVLVDAAQKRVSFLVWAAVELELSDRIEVWCGRAEDLAHDGARRGSFDAVVARGFGPPASTLECGAPLLSAGGRLILSEPPEYRTFPAEPLARCGLRLLEQRGGLALFESIGPAEAVLPRSWREQARAPLF